MYPSSFEYFRAGSLAHALELMAQYGDDARPLAGGQSLIPLMKLRLASPAVLVDLNPLDELAYVRQENGWLAMGALARHAEVEDSGLVRDHLPLAFDAVRLVGDAQVRNLGTVAGSLAEADPGGDWGPALLALGAEVTCHSTRGQRVVDATDLFRDFYSTDLAPDELLTEVRLRVPPAGSGGAYLKLERRAGDFAVVGVAVQVTVEDRICKDIGIGLAGAGATPIKPAAAEAALRGGKLDEASIAEAARCIDQAIDPPTDTRASAEYRREMVGVFFRRALAKALERTSSPSPATAGEAR